MSSTKKRLKYWLLFQVLNAQANVLIRVKIHPVWKRHLVISLLLHLTLQFLCLQHCGLASVVFVFVFLSLTLDQEAISHIDSWWESTAEHWNIGSSRIIFFPFYMLHVGGNIWVSYKMKSSVSFHLLFCYHVRIACGTGTSQPVPRNKAVAIGHKTLVVTTAPAKETSLHATTKGNAHGKS